jgi:hypothetical protein
MARIIVEPAASGNDLADGFVKALNLLSESGIRPQSGTKLVSKYALIVVEDPVKVVEHLPTRNSQPPSSRSRLLCLAPISSVPIEISENVRWFKSDPAWSQSDPPSGMGRSGVEREKVRLARRSIQTPKVGGGHAKRATGRAFTCQAVQLVE